MDPWNGSGTTTLAAYDNDLRSVGVDLNPVMVIAAKAGMLNSHQLPNIQPLASNIVQKAGWKLLNIAELSDPLTVWLTESSVLAFRQLEAAIQQLLIDENNYEYLINRKIDNISDTVSFFYVALFRTVREILLEKFASSNPTWIKRPESLSDRISVSLEQFATIFQIHVSNMILSIHTMEGLSQEEQCQPEYRLQVGSSTNIALTSSSVDLVFSSPPYCTRIDYAVATRPELAVVGYHENSSFDELRRRMIGTATVPAEVGEPNPEWGQACLQFLAQIFTHTSKASQSYYYKNHFQYFESVFLSLQEISRLLRDGGGCVLVVQDSYYKDIHNDLAHVFVEMAYNTGLNLNKRANFSARTMASVNPSVKLYRSGSEAVESVLCFTKRKYRTT